jgi:Zn-dependent M16 (insulinase) family peptidase
LATKSNNAITLQAGPLHDGADQLVALVECVVRSTTFENSPRLRELLQYIGECTARGAVNEL